MNTASRSATPTSRSPVWVNRAWAFQDLLTAALLKSRAHDCWITELTQKGQELHFTFFEKAPLNVEKVGPFMSRYNRRLRFVAGGKSYFAYSLPPGRKAEQVLGETTRLLEEMRAELF